MYLDIVKPIPFHSRILEHISCSFVRPSKAHFDLRWSEKNENLPSQSLHWTRHDRRHFVNIYCHLCPSPFPPKRNLVGETGEHVEINLACACVAGGISCASVARVLLFCILVPRGRAPFGQHQESRFLVLTKRSEASGNENVCFCSREREWRSRERIG